MKYVTATDPVVSRVDREPSTGLQDQDPPSTGGRATGTWCIWTLSSGDGGANGGTTSQGCWNWRLCKIIWNSTWQGQYLLLILSYTHYINTRTTHRITQYTVSSVELLRTGFLSVLPVAPVTIPFPTQHSGSRQHPPWSLLPQGEAMKLMTMSHCLGFPAPE